VRSASPDSVIVERGATTSGTGTDNLDYTITDGKGDVIIESGFNLTATNSAPATLIPNPRGGDTVATHRRSAPSHPRAATNGFTRTGCWDLRTIAGRCGESGGH